ncbi:MAG: hypothetical protein H6565_14240 [Lewinellaceae bacterium]|nr:hypothetical protein [Lewinellaceae bacterium]
MLPPEAASDPDKKAEKDHVPEQAKKGRIVLGKVYYLIVVFISKQTRQRFSLQALIIDDLVKYSRPDERFDGNEFLSAFPCIG